MSVLKRSLALGLTFVMLFSMTACTKRVKEYDYDSFNSFLEEDLGIDEEDIYSYEDLYSPDSASVTADIVTAKYGDARINAMFFNDPDDARDQFISVYDEFTDTFDQGESFEGKCEYKNADDFGYIVINGTDIGTGAFGERYSAGDVYVAVYYTGSMLIVIMPEDLDSDLSDIGSVIDALGYPDV